MAGKRLKRKSMLTMLDYRTLEMPGKATPMMATLLETASLTVGKFAARVFGVVLPQ
ncbi:hypothetical protein GCM10023115_13670 [Pontixanthobacter gangjinensis]|uniref:Uncharacterized protein n=1 Tax=Pontixanthobacter gangjinensis TaxID=1028742 RepID=A0A6I4SL47_9SPHN|nr:hypothetical protein [Pontixanthobacter gangjinensis]MXO56611.1 hypothetical protein [Pontixanthobacter gangjinensis]